MAKIFITGSSDGLGLLAAKKLIETGNQVVVHARNEARAKSAIKEAPDATEVLTGDLSSIEETKQLASKVNELGAFHAIIHNAGVYQVPHHARSKDGIPLLFAVNSLAPYILTALIDRPEKLIYLSSAMHRNGNASKEKLPSILDGTYYPSYSDTKLHDLIITLAIDRKWPEVISNAVDPGWVPTKMGGRNATDNLQKGYETQVWLASENDPETRNGGRLLYHKKETKFNQQANDLEIQETFISVCKEITGLSF